MQFLHFEDFVELLKELHSEALLSEIIVTLDDYMDEFVAWQVTVRRGLNYLLVLRFLSFSKGILGRQAFRLFISYQLVARHLRLTFHLTLLFFLLG